MQTISEIWRSDRGTLVGVARARGWGRLRGLIAAPEPGRARALLIPRCRFVHGICMGFAIDVVFLDRSLRVLRVAGLRPWRLAACTGATHVLELRGGECARLGIAPGDRFASQSSSRKESGTPFAVR